MHFLLPYYLFLALGAVLLFALRDSPLVSQRRALYVGYLLAAPLLLLFLELNLGFALTFLLTIALTLGINRLLRANPRGITTPATFRLWLAAWLVEAVLPLTLYLALQSSPALQRLSLLLGSTLLIAGTLVVFLVVSPDFAKTEKPLPR